MNAQTPDTKFNYVLLHDSIRNEIEYRVTILYLKLESYNCMKANQTLFIFKSNNLELVHSVKHFVEN